MSGQWIATNEACCFHYNNWTIELNPYQPELPVKFSVNSGKTPVSRSSGAGEIRWPALAIAASPAHSNKLEEIYARQNDLIVRYAQHHHDRFSFQVDWRILEVESPYTVGFEVWISIQTDLLDTSPSLFLSSYGQSNWQGWTHEQLLPDSDEPFDNMPSANRSAACWYSENSSYLWLVDPRDRGQVEWLNSTTENLQRIKLFGSFLEKGVIRRARMRLLISDHLLSKDDIQGAYLSLCQSDLPLTA
jgi:hypothetical protein